MAEPTFLFCIYFYICHFSLRINMIKRENSNNIKSEYFYNCNCTDNIITLTKKVAKSKMHTKISQIFNNSSNFVYV